MTGSIRETSAATIAPESSPIAATGFWANRAVHQKQKKKAVAATSTESKPEVDEVMMVSMRRRAKKTKARAEVGNDVRWDLMATVMLELSIANGGSMPGDKETKGPKKASTEPDDAKVRRSFPIGRALPPFPPT